MTSDYAFGFWHPFGAHAGEAREDIVDRKATEIGKNGWTLWSFQHRKTLDKLREVLVDSNGAIALCSDSPSAADPKSSPRKACCFRSAANSKFEPIPDLISVPHPAANRDGLGSAFVVEEIVCGDNCA